MAYDTLSPYAGAYPQTKEELDAQNALTRDVGVGGLRGLTRLTTIADIPTAVEWLGREAYGTQGLTSLLEQSDRMHGGAEGSAATYLNNVYLRGMGVRGDTESQEKAKKLINPLRGGGYHDRVEDIIDTIIPFETTERSEMIEFGALMMGLGWGAIAISKLLYLGAIKGVPWLLTKMKSIVRKGQGEEVLDDIVPEASLQISDKRIDKTVERATGDTKTKTAALEEAGLTDDDFIQGIKDILKETDEVPSIKKVDIPEYLGEGAHPTPDMLEKSVNEISRNYEEALDAIKTRFKRKTDILRKEMKNMPMEEFEAASDVISEEFYSQIDSVSKQRDEYFQLIEEWTDALNREMDLLESGALTRHSRGGLVENKVNYALNQWK